MLLATLLMIAAADPPKAEAPARVLVLETRADAEFLPKVRDFGDLFATILEQRTAAEIIPSSSIKDRLQVAAAKVETGCDDTACMTEIAGAMDARYVVASRASAVGGRWLMRIELFDSQDLKVIAQATAMADSVEGLAQQAEKLADELLSKTTVLPRKGASSSSTNAATLNELPPPDKSEGGISPGLLIGGGIGGVLLSGVTLMAGTIGWGASLGAESDLTLAKDNYIAGGQPDRASREALVKAADAQENAAMINNCIWAPLAWLSLPLCIGGVGAVGWGAVDALAEGKAKGGEE